MSTDKKNNDATDNKQPLPPVDDIEKVSETELDDVAGGMMCTVCSVCSKTE